MKLFLLIIVCFISQLSNASQVSGTIKRVFADPSDIVIILQDKNGSEVSGECGSFYYHIQRSNDNFTEFYSLVLTAAASGKEVNFHVNGCSSSRHLLSHGSVKFG